MLALRDPEAQTRIRAVDNQTARGRVNSTLPRPHSVAQRTGATPALLRRSRVQSALSTAEGTGHNKVCVRAGFQRRRQWPWAAGAMVRRDSAAATASVMPGPTNTLYTKNGRPHQPWRRRYRLAISARAENRADSKRSFSADSPLKTSTYNLI